MPSEPSNPTLLDDRELGLTLEPATQISRPVSVPEYYHACIGTSPHTLEQAREVVFVLEGQGVLPAEQWQLALDKVVLSNPGTRLRWAGRRQQARWESDGKPTRLRVIEDCTWDGRSDSGSEFIHASPLLLEAGPTSELIVTPLAGGRTRLVFRVLHAVMDGRGAMHFLHELMRALRSEPLMGTNAGFSDVDLMQQVGARRSTSRHIKTTALTGAPEGDAVGDTWRRLSVRGSRRNILAKVAVAMAEFAHTSSELPALIAIPVDLRRHLPGLLATTNFSNMLLVPLASGEGSEVFRQKLAAMLNERMETYYLSIFGLIKYLPLSWFDFLVSRRPGNYRHKRPMETAVISNLGRFEPLALSGQGFTAERLYGLPLRGSVFCFLFSVGDQIEITVGLPKVLATRGRLDVFMEYLRHRLDA